MYSYVFKLQSPSKYSPFNAIHLSGHFFHCSEQSLNSLILMPFSASAVFCFTSSTSATRFPLRTFYTQENKKKVVWGEMGWMGKVEHGGHAVFGQKLLNTQHSAVRCACKSPIMKWANALKESSKKIHWSWTQLLTTPPAGTRIQMGS